MTNLEHAARVVVQLQSWIEDRDDLSCIPHARLTWSQSLLHIEIGSLLVYCEDEDETLSFEACKESFLDQVCELLPFIDEAIKEADDEVMDGNQDNGAGIDT